MTFSICVREAYVVDGVEHRRFGVAVTSRVPGVGQRVPYTSANAAVATQSVVNPRLGRKGVEYVDDGLGIEDALTALLNADEGAHLRQVHGVDGEGTFAHSGDGCDGWYGHRVGEGYTVAGNHLTGESVVAATAGAYESSERDEPLAGRLIASLAAGQREGGDDRADELPVQSAAVRVQTTEPLEQPDPTHDLRIDASLTPVEDLRSTYELAAEGFEQFLAHVRRE